MLDLKFIRENSDAVRLAIEQKGVLLDFDRLLDLDAQLVVVRKELQEAARNRNAASKVGNRASDDSDAQLAAARSASETAKRLKERAALLQTELDRLLLLVPNVPDGRAPVGPDAQSNRVVEQVGVPRVFDFDARTHIELMDINGWGDLQQVTKVSGSRTYTLRNALARLEIALWTWALDKLAARGFSPVMVPALARRDAFIGTGHLPTGEEDLYKLPEDDLFLSGTAEVVLNSLHAGEILPHDQLPILCAGFSPAFRREAGSSGRDVRGLMRVHQFAKVEQYVICESDPITSEHWHHKLLEAAKEILLDLEIPFRIVECSTGDMGVGKVRMHDIEAWVPSLNEYRETHSCSTLHDWQARRTNTRYRDRETGDVRYVHTLNNTAIATPRILVPLLENHQTASGQVMLPPKLREIMGRDLL